MKKIVLILFVSLNCLTSKAQTIKEDLADTHTGLTDAELQKAIDAYVKMTETNTYKEYKKIAHKLNEKLNQEVTPKELMKDDEWEKWIAENLKKTKFVSITEANNLRNLSLKLTKQQLDENAELYKMIKKSRLHPKV